MDVVTYHFALLVHISMLKMDKHASLHLIGDFCRRSESWFSKIQ